MQQILAVANSLGLPAIAAVLAWFGWNYLKDVKDGIKEVKVELKGDILEVKGEIREVKAELKGEILEVKGEIREVKAELKGEILELRSSVDELKNILIKNSRSQT